MADDTRKVVLAFLDEVARTGLGGGARRFAAQDVIWWLPGSVRAEPFKGLEEVTAWFDVRGDTGKLFEEPPAISTERVIVDGDLAAAQFHARGSTRSGRTYDNRYMIVMTVTEGKITEMRECYDTQHVTETLHAGPPGGSPKD